MKYDQARRPGVTPRIAIGLAWAVFLEASVLIGLFLLIIYGLPIVAVATGYVR